jgi:hypothetical protein
MYVKPLYMKKNALVVWNPQAKNWMTARKRLK